jgi:hypothetical protein
VIGDGAVIGPGCVLGANVAVGAGSRLVARVTVLDDVRIGARCILQPGAVIGADGFGFAPDAGKWFKIPQLGGVVIGDDVEIGANTCVDRGTIDDTVIEDGVKLDNPADRPTCAWARTRSWLRCRVPRQHQDRKRAGCGGGADDQPDSICDDVMTVPRRGHEVHRQAPTGAPCRDKSTLAPQRGALQS